jgi:lysophospholipase L1-like esterase
MAAPHRPDPWSAPTPARRSHPTVPVVLAATIGAAGPLLLLLPDRQLRAAALVAVLALATAVGLDAVARRRPLRAALAAPVVVAAAVALPSEGRSSGAVAVLGAAAALAALVPVSYLHRVLHPSVDLTGEGRRSASLALVAGAQVLFLRHHPELAVAVLALVLVLGEVTAWRPGPSRAADRGLERAVTALTRALALVVVLVAATPTVYLFGALRGGGRALRPGRGVDPPGWVRRARVRVPGRSWRDPFVDPAPAPPGRRLVGAGVVAALLVVPAVVVLVAGNGDDTGATRPITFPDFAFPDEPWVDDLYEAGFGVTFHPSLGWQSTEVDSRYLQVRDGIRRSRLPGAPGPTVWFLGGSAMWGLGQRDDHTIASEVSRLAERAGTPIRAVNLAVPGYNQWQQTQAMGFRLSRGERPDLVVYYDGANDLTSMLYRAGEGMDRLDVPPNRFHATIEADTRYPPEPRTGTPATRDALVDAFDSMYGAGVDLARRTAAAYGVPMAVYWQPQYLSTRPSDVDGPLLDAFPQLRPGPSDFERDVMDAVRHRLPDGVVDLGSALDGAGAPTWFDPVHTNELGARLVAEEMWDTLSGTVRSLEPVG